MKMTKVKITRDSGANLKIIKRLEKMGFVDVYDVKYENETKKVKNKVLPIGVWDRTKWDECVWAGSDCSYDSIRETIGKENIGDAIKLEAHIRMKNDYFVTEDHDFLDKRSQLKRKFKINILTSEELKKLCNRN